MCLLQRYEDRRLQQAAEDLARTQDEIDGLHHVLREKDRAVRSEITHTDKSQLTIGKEPAWLLLQLNQGVTE